MNKFSQKLRKAIAYLENPDTPFLYPVLLFCSAVVLRNFLELFSDRVKLPLEFLAPDHVLYGRVWLSLFITFFHYFLFWIATVLGLGLIFTLLTRETITKTLRVVLSFALILIITPLFDLLISQGAGISIRYLYPKSLIELLPLPWVLTPGITFTATTGITLTFIYAKIKSNSLLKGLLAGGGLYLLLLGLGTLPATLNVSHPIPIARALLLIILVEIVAIFFLARRDYFMAVAGDLRPGRLFHFCAMLVAGIVFTGQSPLRLLVTEWASFSLIVASIALAWLAAIIFNNLEDYQIDKISNQARPLMQGLNRKDYEKIGLAVLFLTAIFSLGVNFQTFFFILLLVGNSFLYSLPPLKLKRIPIFSKFFIAFNSLIIVMLGYIFAGGKLLAFPPVIIWYFTIPITLAINFIDLKDYPGDKAAGIKTLPVLLGPKQAKLIIGVFFLAAYAALPWVLADLWLLPPALILGVTQFFLINKKTYQERWVLLTYLATLALVLFYLTSLGRNFLS